MAKIKIPSDKKTTKQTMKQITEKPTFPIVGLGASAGGLEAYETFFKAMPPDSGMAFVLVSHLDPTHISILPEIIKKRTQMKVQQVSDGNIIEPNNVYVIPPNKDLTILNGKLYLMELQLPRGHNLPIDNFFRSLAQDQGSNAICIILSGTGTDGTRGANEIKAGLGMVMVQDEESAKYDGMPRSAIATGLVDYILPVEKMPAQLIKYTKHALVKADNILSADEDIFQKALNKIFIILRSHTSHDFSCYKKNTIFRRIERRMHVHLIDNIMDYVAYLQKSTKEVHILFKDLLIGVTSFFRDPEAFESLQNIILANRLKGKPDDYRFRIWVAGCSSGEEAYSIAILMQECMEQTGRHFDVQIFGTDIDEEAINIARSGNYPISIAADVSTERLNRYFTKEDNYYKIKKSIREMLIFAPQNLIKDPPFTKLDVLSCRNLLIYFGPELQKKVLPVFHYSLKEDGVLFLGSSESIGHAVDLFKIKDKKWKIFNRQHNSSVAHPVLDFPVEPINDEVVIEQIPEKVNRAVEIKSLKLVETILQESNTPPCVIIDKDNNIVYIHGRTCKYLEPAIGKASLNILEMAKPGLKVVLSSLICKVVAHKYQVVQNEVEVQDDGRVVTVDLLVKPIQEWGPMQGFMMVVFNEPKQVSSKTKSGRPKKDKNLARIEQELQYTKENLQTTIEELETSNEELKSSNEELQSTNEELQSTNEEMETSKEELQSLNEESTTVNAELQNRIDELSKTTDDMKNLLDSTRIATIFLDIDLCIRRFTPAATNLIPLSNTDLGRPISHFATELKDVRLTSYAENVLKDLVVREDEVQTFDNRVIKIRILPYRTIQNVIDGVVITFEDITEAKRLGRENEKRRILLETVLESTSNGIMACDENGLLSYFNTALRELHGLPLKPVSLEERAKYYDLYEVDGKTLVKPENIPLLKVLQGEEVVNRKYVIVPKGLKARMVSVTGRLMADSGGDKLGAMVSMSETTEKKQE